MQKSSVLTSLGIDTVIAVVTFHGNIAAEQLPEKLINQCFSNASSSLVQCPPREHASPPPLLHPAICILSWTDVIISTIFSCFFLCYDLFTFPPGLQVRELSTWSLLKWTKCGASLVAQWLRIRLPMQGTWVRALVREDPTCRGATKPVHHNY